MKYGVGIDVSKGKSTISILSIEGEVIEMPFDINHDVENLEKLDKKLQMFSKEDLKIVLEQTGTYHLPILIYLLDKGYCVIAENALKIKKYLDRSLRKAKTDKKDSLKLAEYACDNWYKLKANKEIYDAFLKEDYAFIFDNLKETNKEKEVSHDENTEYKFLIEASLNFNDKEDCIYYLEDVEDDFCCTIASLMQFDNMFYSFQFVPVNFLFEKPGILLTSTREKAIDKIRTFESLLGKFKFNFNNKNSRYNFSYLSYNQLNNIFKSLKDKLKKD